jgi:hypothetical protein
MRAGTFDRFTVISRAFVQGTRWGCTFKIGKTEPSFSVTTDFQDESFCEQTLESREEAEIFLSAKGKPLSVSCKSGPDRP